MAVAVCVSTACRGPALRIDAVGAETVVTIEEQDGSMLTVPRPGFQSGLLTLRFCSNER